MSKQVMLSEEAYHALSAAKGPDESFSDVIVRTFGPNEEGLRKFERWVRESLPDPDLADSIEEARRKVRWRMDRKARR